MTNEVKKDKKGEVYLLNNGQKTKCPYKSGFCSSVCPHFEYYDVQEVVQKTRYNFNSFSSAIFGPSVDDLDVWHEPTGIVLHKVQLTCGGQLKRISVGKSIGNGANARFREYIN